MRFGKRVVASLLRARVFLPGMCGDGWRGDANVAGVGLLKVLNRCPRVWLLSRPRLNLVLQAPMQGAPVHVANILTAINHALASVFSHL